LTGEAKRSPELFCVGLYLTNASGDTGRLRSVSFSQLLAMTAGQKRLPIGTWFYITTTTSTLSPEIGYWFVKKSLLLS
jgi:hypothetical protein